jgi:hypothetical protein
MPSPKQRNDICLYGIVRGEFGLAFFRERTNPVRTVAISPNTAVTVFLFQMSIGEWYSIFGGLSRKNVLLASGQQTGEVTHHQKGWCDGGRLGYFFFPSFLMIGILLAF